LLVKKRQKKRYLMNQQKVKLVYLQSPTTIPGVFTSMTTLDAQKLPGIEMYLLENGGITVSIKNVTAFIASANIKIALLEEVKSKGK